MGGKQLSKTEPFSQVMSWVNKLTPMAWGMGTDTMRGGRMSLSSCWALESKAMRSHAHVWPCRPPNTLWTVNQILGVRVESTTDKKGHHLGDQLTYWAAGRPSCWSPQSSKKIFQGVQHRMRAGVLPFPTAMQHWAVHQNVNKMIPDNITQGPERMKKATGFS